MSDPRASVILSILLAASCLTPPDPTGPTRADAGGDDMHVGADTAPDGDDCDGCTLGARQCGVDEAGHEILEVCEEAEGGDATCTRWVASETCEPAQTCSAALGCACPTEDACVPGDPLQCPAIGVLACVIVDGCPRAIDIGRDSACAAPDPTAFPPCEENSQQPWCVGCDDGRECEDTCGNGRGYACGIVPVLR